MIQQKTGGNLAEVLSNLSKVIRDRFRMFPKIRAVSSEGRLSAVIIGAMPLVVFGIVNLISPTYFGDVLDDPWFYPAIGVGVVLMLLGQIVILKLVNFRF